MLMTCCYPDLGSASDWLKQTLSPHDQSEALRSIWVVTRHWHGISVLVPQIGGKPVVVHSLTACCFLRLLYLQLYHVLNKGRVDPKMSVGQGAIKAVVSRNCS